MRKLSWTATKGLCLFVLIWTTGVATVHAQSAYPAAREAYVNDFTGRLSPLESRRIRTYLEKAREETGVELTVVVIHSIHDYATNDASIESFATHLFNEWGLGDAERDDGVLFLVALGDRHVRIEVGSGYGAYNDELMRRILDQDVLPRFKTGEVGEGIFAGVRAILLELMDWLPPVARPAPRPAAAPKAHRPATPAARPAGKPIYLEIAFGLVFLGGAAMGGRAFYRYRRRRCRDCGAAMRRLGGPEEDGFLSSGQEAEENLRSMDYDVWKCDGCGHTAVTSWRRWLSFYRKCPSCGHRTVLKRRCIISPASYSSTGAMDTVWECAHCDYERRKRVTIPRLLAPVRRNSSASSFSSWRGTSIGDDSSSGSSYRPSPSHRSSGGGSSSSHRPSGGGSRSNRRPFGGGSSSGGGATGSW